MTFFKDTKIAFISKTDRDLKQARLLFQALSKNWLVKTANGFLQSALKMHLPVGWIVKPTVYHHFCGGETIRECLPVVNKMEAYNVKAILDYSVEGTETPDSIYSTLEETIQTIHNAAGNKNIPFAVFKPTAFTLKSILEKASNKNVLTGDEKEEISKFRDRIHLLCETAFKMHVPILIDAEHSWFQPVIDEIVEEMMQLFNKKEAIVFNTFQMYRTDRLAYLKESLDRAESGCYFLGAKFVRGAYMERERERAGKLNYPSPVHATKEATDHDYNEALRFSVEHIHRIAIFNGTHNEYSCWYLTELMKENGIDKNDPHMWFSQLYGMSDHISYNLASDGYNVAKYVPYGPVKHVLPYLIRRAEENTSVKGQSGRELSLIKQELKRRKKEK